MAGRCFVERRPQPTAQPRRFNPCLYGADFLSRVFSTDSLEANFASNLCRCRTHLRRVHIGSTGSQVTALGERGKVMSFPVASDSHPMSFFSNLG